MAKNALQTALDLVKSGALRTMATSPMGQFASKVGQASSFLRAPSMEDLGNAYNQAVGRASSFVQKYPSPASYVAQRVPLAPQPSSYSPVQTFQENMKLMSRPVQSLTTETPAARFIINKVGSPAQDIFTGKLSGPQTVGNYIGQNLENVFAGLLPMTPYAPTIISGLKSTPGLLPKIAASVTELATLNPQMKVRNILKEGLNIPAGVIGTGAALAFQSGLKFLKGEKMTKEEMATAGLLGFGIGSVVPSPMKGIATTDLGAARKFLSDYGFKLSDYENPTLLKAKFRRNILNLHPDKGGDPEAFKSFIDAYNKATSAGIDSSWKFPDVMAWIRNLWTKKQQPTGGSMIKVGQPTPTTATEGLFGKIANVVQQQSGEGFHTFEGPQIRTVLKKAGLNMIPEGTVETPGFIVQYRKKDYLGNPIPPVLQVNVFPEGQQVQPPAPQVVQSPSVQPITPVPQVPKLPIVAQPIQVPKIATPVHDEPASPALLDHFREAARTVNVDELVKLNAMSTSEANRYVEQIAQQQPSTVTTGVQPTVIDVAYQTTIKNGGVTIDFAGSQPKQGFSYSPYPELQTIISKEKFTENNLKEFEIKNKDLLLQSGHFIGTWIKKETREVYLDVVVVGPPTAETLQNAMNAKQEAIFNLASLEGGWEGEITIGRLDKGVYNILDEATNIFDQYTRKIPRAGNEGGVAGVPQIPEGASAVDQGSLPAQAPTQQVVPQAPSVQPVVAPSPVGIPIQPTIPPPKPGEKIRGFIKTVLESDIAEEKWKNDIVEKMRLYYTQKGNPQTMGEAEAMIKQNPEGTQAKVFDLNERSETLNAAGQLLAIEAQQNGNFDLANRILDVLAEKGLQAGREAQIFAIWDKFSPTGRVQYAKKVVKDATEKLTKWDKKINKISSIEEAPKIAADISKEMNAVNKEAIETVATEAAGKFQKLAKKVEKESADVKLGKRIIRYTKSLLTTEERKNDPIANMVNALYRVAQETLPKKETLPKDPLQFIAEAIKDKEKYRDVWEMAQDIVKEKFTKNQSALDLLDDYFAAYLTRPFAQKQLHQLVTKRLKENDINLAQVVRDFYVDAQKRVGETLATRLSEEAGFLDEDARMLEGYVTKRFNEITAKKKEQILTTLTKEKPKLAQKPFLKRILELSNLGAFGDKRYYDLVAKRLNIPNVSEGMAQELFTKTQQLQTLSEGSKEREKLVVDVMNLISDQIPPGMVDIFDAYRYQNLLSNPRTFLLRNPFWNLLEATVFVPSELAIESGIDWLHSTLKGKPRELYANIPAYYKGLFNAIPDAVDVGRKVWQGTSPIENPDIRYIKFRALQRTHPKLTVIPRLMEIGDQSFRVLIAQAYSSSLQATGVTKDIADEIGKATALEALLRRRLDPQNIEERGALISGLDMVGNAMLRSEEH